MTPKKGKSNEKKSNLSLYKEAKDESGVETAMKRKLFGGTRGERLNISSEIGKSSGKSDGVAQLV